MRGAALLLLVNGYSAGSPGTDGKRYGAGGKKGRKTVRRGRLKLGRKGDFVGWSVAAEGFME